MKQNVEKSPLVSVCIPTYNRVAKLERAVLAIQEQTYKNIEIIISDNVYVFPGNGKNPILKELDEYYADRYFIREPKL